MTVSINIGAYMIMNIKIYRLSILKISIPVVDDCFVDYVMHVMTCES